MSDPAIEHAFAKRSTGRARLAAHVANRLAAEQILAPGWTIDTAAAYLSAATSFGPILDLTVRHHWTQDQLRRHLSHALRAALIDPRHAKESS